MTDDLRAELARRVDAEQRMTNAKATRLGHAEHPELLRLDGDVCRLLWAGPCDLAAGRPA